MMPDSPIPGHRRRLLMLAGAVVLAACGGDGGGAATEPPPPVPPTAPVAVPGTLTVSLVTPNTDDGAILLEITGPAPAGEPATAMQGVVVHARASGNTSRVAAFGAIGAGALLRFSVPDVNAAQQYTARAIEASDRGSALRTSVAGYQLTIAP